MNVSFGGCASLMRFPEHRLYLAFSQILKGLQTALEESNSGQNSTVKTEFLNRTKKTQGFSPFQSNVRVLCVSAILIRFAAGTFGHKLSFEAKSHFGAVIKSDQGTLVQYKPAHRFVWCHQRSYNHLEISKFWSFCELHKLAPNTLSIHALETFMATTSFRRHGTAEFFHHEDA
ncbi:hypothetical protein L596_018103 [Steinernema carpocapsae]|uniref:Uncharacterized protein n=1 Tax=Steinernema carpocapsae TaxID=34508 RepID=A0A4U5N3M2_STECR|nr:hypothetical protein L596_018103 [Steinernema carpocapsae]